MSKNVATEQSSRNVFSQCQDNIDTLLNGMKRSVPHYHQSITNVQQEYIQAYENIMNSSIALQKEYVKKAGITAELPESTAKATRNVTEGFVKATSLQNQIMLTTIDATQRNIQMFNDNAKSVFDLNRNILQSWSSAFIAKDGQ